MSRCPSCGAAVDERDERCQSCGAAVSPGDGTADRSSRGDGRSRTNRGSGPGGQRSTGRRTGGGRTRGQGGRTQGGRRGQLAAQRQSGQSRAASQSEGQPQGGQRGERNRAGRRGGRRTGGGRGQQPASGGQSQPQPAGDDPAAGGTGRRDFVKYGAGLALLGGAGWMAYDEFLGDDGRMRDAEWLAAPDELDVDDYWFGRLSVAGLRRHESDLDADAVDQLRSDLEDDFGLRFSGVDGLVTGDEFLVITGDVPQDDAESALMDDGFEPTSEYGDHQLLEDGDAAAVSGDSVVVSSASSSTSAADRVETLIDAADGRADRYYEVDADCDAMLSELGQGLSLGGYVLSGEWFSDRIDALGTVQRFGGDVYDVGIVLVFPDAEAVDVEDPPDVEDRYDVEVSDLQNADLSVDGRVVSVDAEIPVEDAHFGDPLP